MKVTPLDIQIKKFPASFKGLNKEAVDSFLKTVREVLEDLLRENAALKEERAKREQEIADFREKESSLKNTLIGAQQMVKEYRENALREIEALRLETAVESEKILEDAQSKVSTLKADTTDLRRLRKNFENEMRTILQNHLKMLEDLEESEYENEAASNAHNEKKNIISC